MTDLSHPRSVDDAPTSLLRDLPAEPLVTVVLPSFNAEDYIADAVSSVRRSTYANWRCVVVDDGSTDATLARARAASGHDPRFVFRSQDNAGHIAAINAAARCVTGHLVALLDNDDVFLPDKLDRVVSAFLSKPAAGLVTHRLYVGDEDLAIAGVTPLAHRLPDGNLRPRLLRQTSGDPSLGVTSGMVLRREIFDLIFPTDTRIERFPDELIRRVAPLAADVTACDEPLGIRRTHHRNQSDDVGDGLADYVTRSLASYHLIRACQQRTASKLALELPAADLDLDLMEAILARLEARSDARDLRRRVVGSSPFELLPAVRRIYWRFALTLPRPLLAVAVRQLYGVSNVKLLLNWRWMRRLRRAGAIPDTAPGTELSLWEVARRALPRRRLTVTSRNQPRPSALSAQKGFEVEGFTEGHAV